MDEPVSQPNIFRRFFGFISSSSSSRTLGALAILIVAAAIPLTVYIAQQRQETRGRAAEQSGPFYAQASDVSSCNAGGGCWLTEGPNANKCLLVGGVDDWQCSAPFLDSQPSAFKGKQLCKIAAPGGLQAMEPEFKFKESSGSVSCVVENELTSKCSDPNALSYDQSTSTYSCGASGSDGVGGSQPSACKDNPVAPPSSAYVWKALCQEGCTSNAQCPKNISLPASEQDKSNWCYDFGGTTGSKCLQLQRVSAGGGTTGKNSGSSTTSTVGTATGCSVAKANNGPSTVNNYCAFNLAQPPRTFNVGPADLPEGGCPEADQYPELTNAGGYYTGLWCANPALRGKIMACSRGTDGCDGAAWMDFFGRAANLAGAIPGWTTKWNDTQARRSIWNYLMAQLKIGKQIYYRSPSAGTAVGNEYDLSMASNRIFPPPPRNINDGALWWGYQLQREKDNNCAVTAWDKLCLSDSDCSSGYVCEKDWGNCPSNHPPSFTCVPKTGSGDGGGGEGTGGTPETIGGKITDCTTGKGIGGALLLINHGTDKFIEDTNADGTWSTNKISQNDLGYGIWPQCVSGLKDIISYNPPSGYLCNSSVGPKALNSPNKTWSGTTDFPHIGNYYDPALDGLPKVNGSPINKNFDFCYTSIGGSTLTPTPTPPPGCYYQNVQCIQAPCDPVLVCPSLTPTPSGSTTLSFNLVLPGIGGQAGNPSPLNPARKLKVQIFNSSNNQVGSDQSGDIAFDSQSATFKGTVDIGAISQGAYTIKVKTDKYLRKLISGVQNLASGLNQMPNTTMVVGDINGDNKLNISDYNILVTCFGDKANSASCGASNKQAADLNDDGKVSDPDYKLFIDSLSVQEGD